MTNEQTLENPAEGLPIITLVDGQLPIPLEFLNRSEYTVRMPWTTVVHIGKRLVYYYRNPLDGDKPYVPEGTVEFRCARTRRSVIVSWRRAGDGW